MSRRSDRAARRNAVKQANSEAAKARSAARKAFDLKDPRFLGEAAVAATRGPVGLALFGAGRGVQALRERRAEQAAILGDLASDAKEHAQALRERTPGLAAPQPKPGPLRRFAPLWIIGLLGGAAVAGFTAFFLRDQGSSAPAAAPTPAPEPAGAEQTSTEQITTERTGAEETGEDLTMESPDPEGPGDQTDGTSPAAGA